MCPIRASGRRMPAGINSAVSPLTVQTCVHCTLLRTRRDITLCLHCEVHKSENHQRWFKPTHLPQRKPEPRSAWARIHSAGDQRKRRGGAGHHLATSVLRRVTHSHMPLDAEHRKQHTDPFPTSGSSTHPNLVAIVLKRAIRQTHHGAGPKREVREKLFHRFPGQPLAIHHELPYSSG